MSNLYKYAGPSNIDNIFHSPENISFRCSYPKDFNDPYELFLTIDFNQEPDILAFYEGAVGKIPQRPTTCFSKSPAVIPMWAHYAQNHEGFVIELDEERVKVVIENAGFGDINYQDQAGDGIQDTLERAFHIGKPRYMYFLHRSVLRTAYFTKSSCWSYEAERRMIVDEESIRRIGDMMLVDIPASCISSIIVGSRAHPDTREKLHNISSRIKCNIFDINIGRSSTTPFFRTKKGRTSIFNGSTIERSQKYCCECGEPVVGRITKCSWCRINEAHKLNATYKNPYRALAGAGILGSYIEGMERITNAIRK